MSGQTSDRGVRRLFVRAAVAAGAPPMGAKAKFDAWLTRHDAEVERASAEKAYDKGASDTERFYQSLNPAYWKTPLPMPVNPYRRHEGGGE